MTPPRFDGYAAIEDYALLGDGRSVALVSRDGRIDWWPVPTLDASPLFAAILDAADGGYLEVCPVDDYSVARCYRPGTNVLETTFTTATGSVRVTDALNVGGAGPLPWGELARRVDGLTGTVEMRWTVAPGTRLESAPQTSMVDGTPLITVGDQRFAVLPFDVGIPIVGPQQVSAYFTTAPHSRGLLAVVTTDGEPTFLPEHLDLDHHLDRTVARWREWSSWVRYDGRWADAVLRSGLVLKLLLHAPTGAIAAAPTTSLPERIGGEKNWDYRFMWVRDAAFSVDALMELGLHEEVQAAVSFLLGAIRRTAPDLHVFYTLAGTVPHGCTELDVDGYRGSRPVLSGNGAATQTQLGTFGDLLDTIWRYVESGHILDAATGEMLADLADRCCDLWREPDAGIWELPQRRHYTFSKMGCWVALDRAVSLAGDGGIPEHNVERWRSERDEIHSWVDTNCWSEAKRSYTFYAGSDELDAATLLAAQTGFDRSDRLAGTVAAVQRELAEGPLVYRYSGMRREEGAFVACTFWLVTALTHLGRRDEAAALMDDAVALSNDVGLLAEQVATDRRTMLGNFPQGLSHLALINAATELARPAPAEVEDPALSAR